MPQFTLSSRLNTGRDKVARQILTMRGVNQELFPFLYMTTAHQWKEKPLVDWPLGEYLFSSFILLFGMVPIDRHHFRLESVSESGFSESSSSVLNYKWIHCRRIESADGGCLVTDCIEYQSRLSFLGLLLKPVYSAVFKYRHWRLRRQFGRQI